MSNFLSPSVQSTVKDIQSILDEKLKLPEGYYYNYGGEFENLQSAAQRLLIVVPVALIIILLLLYATVRNLRESLFVFSAIPLAAIGGVWALWLRGMPFSIHRPLWCGGSQRHRADRSDEPYAEADGCGFCGR